MKVFRRNNSCPSETLQGLGKSEGATLCDVTKGNKKSRTPRFSSSPS